MSRDNIPELEEFRDIRGKFQSNYTIIVNGMSFDEVLNIMYKKLELVNKLKDNVKKKHLNDTLYSFVEYLKQQHPEDKDNTLYLVGANLKIINLKKSWKSILNEWNVPKFTFRNDEYFDIDYLNSLFTDDSYYDIIKIKNKTVTHTHLNPHKRRIKTEVEAGKEFNLEEFISKNVKNQYLIHGVSSLIKNFKSGPNALVFNKTLRDEDILQEFEKSAMQDIHAIIQELFGHMMNDKMSHRVKVGKDIQKAIQYAQLETLYCTPTMAKNVREKIPQDLQNFKIIEVKTLEKGDTGDTLDRDYKGAIGFTYY